MNQRRTITKEDSRTLWGYLFYAFALAWGTEFIMIAVYHFNLLSGGAALFFHFTILGFGAGLAPAYAAFIVQRKRYGITVKDICKQILYTTDVGKTILFIIVFALIQFVACVVQESYLGNPWYLFILYIPLMIFGGGLEEIGWRGVFQPLLEKRFSFIMAALIEGVIWSLWHLPLWFVPNASQGSMNFLAFSLYTVTLGITLAAIYRLTDSIWAGILIHAWGNTVLGGMYTLASLNNFPNTKTLIVYAIQILVILLIMTFQKKYGKVSQPGSKE